MTKLVALEVTIKNLREKVKELEDSVESRVSSRLVEKERELAKSYEEKNQLIASSQVDVEKKLTESEHNSHALQSGLTTIVCQKLFYLAYWTFV